MLANQKLLVITCSTGIWLLVAPTFAAGADQKPVKPAPPAKAAPIKPTAKAAPTVPNAHPGPKPPMNAPGNRTSSAQKSSAPVSPRQPNTPPRQQSATPTPRPSALRQPQQAQRQVRTLPNGNLVTTTHGRTRDIHVPRSNMDVHNNLRGGQQLTIRRPDGSLVSAQRGSRSFVEHSYRVGARDYSRRTYVYNGRSYDRYYQPYTFHNVAVESYSPPVYYAAPYYGWIYNPWQAPVSYAWGWNSQPWSGYYGNYFAPSTSYPNASLWLTDYLVSQSLQESYQAQTAAETAQLTNTPSTNSASSPGPIHPPAPISPEVKQQVAQEVQRQIAIESDEANKTAAGQPVDPALSGLGRILTDGAPHVFVAGRTIDVVDATGLECAVSEGDVLSLPKPPPGAATAADLFVLTSKGDPDCHPGATISVAFVEIQEMQNHMRDLIDQGMGTLHDQGGKNGLPVPPPSTRSVNKPDFAAQAPPPDPNAAAEIERDLKDADTAAQGVPGTPGPAEGAALTQTPPPTQTQQISLTGMTMDQVTQTLGRPKAVQVPGGNKKVWVYPDMKVTFTNGVVSGIE